MADREVNRCNRICSMNDPDKGCLLGGVESCRIGSEQVMQRVRCDFPFGQRPPIDALLIDANVVLAAIDKEFHKIDPSGEEQIGFLKCRRIIRTAPTVDVVEVMHQAEHYASSYSREYIVALIKEAVGDTTDYWVGLVADALITQGVILAPREEANPRDLSGYADKLREIKAEQAKKAEEKAKKSVEKALEKVGL